MYADTAAKGSVPNAKAKLWKRPNDEWGWDALHIGLFMGMSVPLLGFLLLFIIGGSGGENLLINNTIERLENILPIYRYLTLLSLSLSISLSLSLYLSLSLSLSLSVSRSRVFRCQSCG